MVGNYSDKNTSRGSGSCRGEFSVTNFVEFYQKSNFNNTGTHFEWMDEEEYYIWHDQRKGPQKRPVAAALWAKWKATPGIKQRHDGEMMEDGTRALRLHCPLYDFTEAGVAAKHGHKSEGVTSKRNVKAADFQTASGDVASASRVGFETTFLGGAMGCSLGDQMAETPAGALARGFRFDSVAGASPRVDSGGSPDTENKNDKATDLDDYDLQLAMRQSHAKKVVEILIQKGKDMLKNVSQRNNADSADRVVAIMKSRYSFLQMWASATCEQWEVEIQEMKDTTSNKLLPFPRCVECMHSSKLLRHFELLGAGGKSNVDLKMANKEIDDLIVLHNKIVESVVAADKALTEQESQQELTKKRALEAEQKKTQA